MNSTLKLNHLESGASHNPYVRKSAPAQVLVLYGLDFSLTPRILADRFTFNLVIFHIRGGIRTGS